MNHPNSQMKNEIEKFADYKREGLRKYAELKKQLKEVQNELEELEYKEAAVCQVDKSMEFGGSSSRMVGKILFINKCLFCQTKCKHFARHK